jgi:hypothetical protein
MNRKFETRAKLVHSHHIVSRNVVSAKKQKKRILEQQRAALRKANPGMGGKTGAEPGVVPETMHVEWGGVADAQGIRSVTTADLKESDIKYNGTYSTKHRMAVAILTMLSHTLEGILEPYDRHEAQRDLDWARIKLKK